MICILMRLCSNEALFEYRSCCFVTIQCLFQLKNQSEGNRGAGCNNMIMLFTDGGTDHAQEVFDHYNPKDNMVSKLI